LKVEDWLFQSSIFNPNNMRETKTLIYLIRHGLTEWNLQKRFQGHLAVPLSPEGLEQSRAVGEWLARQPVRFAAIYASDLLRAMQTAQAIGDSLALVPQPMAALREIHGGEWQGLSVEDINTKYPGRLAEWYEKLDSFTLPGGESIPQVQERVFAFYKNVVRQHVGEAIIIVSHGAALSALQAAIHDWDLMETWRTKSTRLGNTGVTALSVEPNTGKASVIVHNSAEHLPRPTGMSSVMDPSA
jgi:broad specificity phosphatase PhoE